MTDPLELETKLAFLEKAHEDLNDVVLRQEKDLAHLSLVVEGLRKRMLQIAESGGGEMTDPATEIPPHY